MTVEIDPMTVEIKSTAQLLDEMTTGTLRLAWARSLSTPELEARLKDLLSAIGGRLDLATAREIGELVVVLIATWEAQEIVMGDHDDSTTAQAARMAQSLNARRASLVRKIDQDLGEGNTVMEKTYK